MSTATTEPGSTTETEPTTVLLQPRDPIVVRDARPFAADPGARAFSLPWPLPRTTAGALRTHTVGGLAGVDWSGGNGRDWAVQARKIHVRGPLMVCRRSETESWEVHVAAPRDVVPYREPVTNGGQDRGVVPGAAVERGTQSTERLKALRLRPRPETGEPVCDVPTGASRRDGRSISFANVALCPLAVEDDVKPDGEAPAYWSLADACAWLGTADHGNWAPPIDRFDAAGNTIPAGAATEVAEERWRGVSAPATEARVHVGIDQETLTGREGALFATEARAFRDAPDPGSDAPATAMLCRVTAPRGTRPVSGCLPLGGERRLVEVTADPSTTDWPCADCWMPKPEVLAAAAGLRLLLVTPAIFAHGWLPAWVANGLPPGLKGTGVKLTLVGAAIDRRIPVSGWRLAHLQKTAHHGERKPGPRATEFAVPAGGVYFFALAAGSAKLDADIWRDLWLAPVSDKDVHCHEGFGLVLPGIW